MARVYGLLILGRHSGDMVPTITRLLAVLLVFFITAARADDSALCRAAISTAESGQRIPDAFLAAIARVESGRPDRQTGGLVAWPWTINAEGVGSFYTTKAEAVDAVRALQARGVRSIDVGCLQVNLLNHPDAFGSLEQAFDPAANASYAGRFLISLFDKMGSWPLAAAAYHSQTPTIGAAYQRRVLAEWAVPNEPGGGAVQSSPIQARHHQGASSPGGSGSDNAALTPRAAFPGGIPPGGIQSADASPAFGRAAPAAVHTAPVAGIAFTGRSLAAYRLIPTALALRPPRKSG